MNSNHFFFIKSHIYVHITYLKSMFWLESAGSIIPLFCGISMMPWWRAISSYHQKRRNIETIGRIQTFYADLERSLYFATLQMVWMAVSLSKNEWFVRPPCTSSYELARWLRRRPFWSYLMLAALAFFNLLPSCF